LRLALKIFCWTLARKAVRITTHDGLIKNANGHIEAGPRPDLPAQPEHLCFNGERQ